jgi:hypothetical protein
MKLLLESFEFNKFPPQVCAILDSRWRVLRHVHSRDGQESRRPPHPFI